MAIEEVINATSDTIVGNLIVEVGRLGLLISGIGILTVILVIFYIISLVLNWKKRNELVKIRQRLESVEEKIDKLLRKK